MLENTSATGGQTPANRTLGAVLKAARTRVGKTLRAVQEETGISNGYLSQLESDAVKMPSPHHLHLLARAYEARYADFMTAAGYPLPEPEASGEATAPERERGTFPSRPVRGMVFAAGFLNSEDEERVRAFAEFLRAQEQSSQEGRRDG